MAALLVGCGGESGSEGKPAAAPSPSKKPKPVFEEVPDVKCTEFPNTAAGRLDKLADERGWTVDDAGAWPSAYVSRICRSMTRVDGEGEHPGRWLAEEEQPQGGRREILKAGMQALCPKWSKEALSALRGDVPPEVVEEENDRSDEYGGGTYAVSSKPDDGMGDLPLIPPGTYRTTGVVEGCYWERTTKGGEIIDNNFATSAQEITVTIRVSDGQFTTENCGTWKKIG
jgi:hypothetical protein